MTSQDDSAILRAACELQAELLRLQSEQQRVRLSASVLTWHSPGSAAFQSALESAAHQGMRACHQLGELVAAMRSHAEAAARHRSLLEDAGLIAQYPVQAALAIARRL